MAKLILTVGNGMMGDDAAGPLLAHKMRQVPIQDWFVIDGGSAPENQLHKIRELAPEKVVIIDSADMDLAPGEIRFIGDRRLDDPFLITTHSLPLSYVIDSIREFVPQVDFIGIQPDIIAFGYPISQSVKLAVDNIYDQLKQGLLPWDVL
jgi:hydrogenase 3 maturation protease